MKRWSQIDRCSIDLVHISRIWFRSQDENYVPRVIQFSVFVVFVEAVAIRRSLLQTVLEHSVFHFSLLRIPLAWCVTPPTDFGD